MNSQEKAQTGLMQFEGDWASVFIRGEEAIDFVIAMEDFASKHPDFAQSESLMSLLKLLKSAGSDTFMDADTVQLKSLEDCESSSKSLLGSLLGKKTASRDTQPAPRYNVDDNVLYAIKEKGASKEVWTKGSITDRRCSKDTDWNWQYKVKTPDGKFLSLFEGSVKHRGNK
jgi:hypothetical protein